MVGLMKKKKKKRGREVISTEGLLAKIEKLNKSMGEWTPTSWWNGRVSNGYTSCGTCVGKTDYSFDENNPEICYCAQQAKNNDGEVTTTSNIDPMGGILTTGPMGEEVMTCTEKLEEVTRGQIEGRSSTTSPKVGGEATMVEKPMGEGLTTGLWEKRLRHVLRS